MTPGDRTDITVEDVRSRNDIVEVVSEFVRLRKAGRSFKGLCPFHREKTPSFMVNPERQIYHCFGCGVGGDVFSFIMAHEKLEFPEALRYLAERAGLPIPRPADGVRTSETEALYRANRFAADFYHRALNSGAGKRALTYLEKRGLTPEMIGFFEVGAAAAGGELLEAARREGIEAETLEKAGLLMKRDGGGWVERFRNRITFPIVEVNGRVVGLGGRLLGEGEPKYLNSPETRVFRKGSHLYGLHWARREISREDRGLLVEGYMDLVALRQYGIENAVASMGTALGAEAARKLARSSRRVTIINDGDEAGLTAAVRSAEVFLAEGFRVHVGLLPPGSDPDSFVRSAGAEAFRQRVLEAPGIVGFLFRDATDYESRERATRRALEMFSQIEDPIRRSWYVKELAERSGLEEQVLQQAATRRKPNVRLGGAAEAPRPKSDAADRAERGLVKYLLETETLDGRLTDEIREAEVRDPAARRVLGVVLTALAEGERLSATDVITRLEDRESRALVAAVSMQEDTVDEAKQVRDYLACLRRRALKERVAEAKKEMREAEAQGDTEALRRLQADYLGLVSALKTQGSGDR